MAAQPLQRVRLGSIPSNIRVKYPKPTMVMENCLSFELVELL